MDTNKKLDIILEGQEKGVTCTCLKHDISRTLYYKWLNRYKENGINGLSSTKQNFVPANKTSQEIEKKILELVKQYPTYGPLSIKYLTEEIGYNISSSCIYNVLKRHNLTRRAQRLQFTAKRHKVSKEIFPPFETLESGNCLFFWLVDCGKFNDTKRLYTYNVYEAKSGICCTRIYDSLSYTYVKELLTDVAIPVAQTLHFNLKLFGILPNALIKNTKQLIEEFENIFDDFGYNVNVHFLDDCNDHSSLRHLQNEHSKKCLAYLLPLLKNGVPIDQLKTHIQDFVLKYNSEYKLHFESDYHTPLEHHHFLTDIKPVLPLWAYIYRPY